MTDDNEMLDGDGNSMLEILLLTTVALLPEDRHEFTARQLAVFLICYLNIKRQTIGGLATGLKVDPAIITRAVNRLEALGLAQRKRNPANHRSVLVGRTREGTKFLRTLTNIVAKAQAAATSAHLE